MSFDLLRPATVDETTEALAVHGDDAVLLAGGQSLLILLRQRLLAPQVVVSLQRVESLRAIEVQSSSSRLGAMVTYRSMATYERLRRRLPLLARAAGSVGSVHIRSRGTVGGSVCHADPAGDVPTALLALDASLRLTRGDGSVHERPVDGFFTGLFETARQEGELLESVLVPLQPATATYGYRRWSFRQGEYPMCVVACRLVRGRDGSCSEARIAVGGAGPYVRRLPALERLLIGNPVDDRAVEDAVAAVSGDIEPVADVRGTASWKRHVVVDAVAGALSEAVHEEAVA